MVMLGGGFTPPPPLFDEMFMELQGGHDDSVGSWLGPIRCPDFLGDTGSPVTRKT